MQPTVLFMNMWNKAYFPAGGADMAYLLVEAHGVGGPADAEKRAPINLSLVLDRSGSMSGEPLMYSKKACRFVADQMNVDDLLSLVVFDDQVETVLPPSKVTHKDLMKQRIDSIDARGTTNLSGGLIEGVQLVRSHKAEGLVNRVILLSDGHANKGITDRAKLFAIAKEYRSSGVGISAMGVGDGFDEELMEGIAEYGGGNFHYIEKADDIPAILGRELEGLLSVTAQNVKLIVRPFDGAQVTAIYGYPAEERESGGSAIAIGDLYQNEVKSILVELTLHPHTPGEHPVLKLDWEYVDVTEGAVMCRTSIDVAAAFTSDIDLLGQPANPVVEQQVELTKSAIVIEQAMKAFDSGDMEQGQQLLKAQADEMLRLSAVMGSPLMAEESAKLYSQLDNFEYSSKKRKELHQEKHRRMKRK
ncbi:VWA domain-containing protein [Cohnella lubricantis]|uniref:VWA domain-containing protein n=1 Tax=Cohnella lubricantis TaxID=2163172 RepID=A0A841T2M8_9BACL|nr:VWA domain-containing protein [Cohnella lubricantis]MBB6675833.1 VWA domain-containing protein [Cohnella lubricantis]MBP2119753.1 Ca-activated chloride channel family protein [Cohnella lubricantis]